ncbi:MAG TPA: protein phosphatase 2C domain-containing protein [Terriglobales bacterium]|nr:protein phosphatase 2C domain-containing protein [Terriglobales bacterium]
MERHLSICVFQPAESMMSKSVIAAYGQSHTGNIRADNQDTIRWYEPEDEIALRDHGRLYGIADGMGGYEHGGVASALALETFFDTFYRGQPSKAQQNMRQGVQNANLAVFQTAQRMNARMGTTLSVVNIVGQQLYVAHVGDSRVYQIRGHKAVCLTNDHTAVGELVRMRVLSPDKVRTHERRSVLEKSLGIELFVQPDIAYHAINEGDYLVLCTDGVWAYVQDEEFAQLVADIGAPEQIGEALIHLALERKSDDNVSVVVVQALQLVPAIAPSETGRLSFAHFFRGFLNGKA